MPAILTPLIAVFGIMLLGTFVQKSKLLPAETDHVLNQYAPALTDLELEGRLERRPGGLLSRPS